MTTRDAIASKNGGGQLHGTPCRIDKLQTGRGGWPAARRWATPCGPRWTGRSAGYTGQPGILRCLFWTKALWFKVYYKTDRFRFYFKHFKSVLAQLLALKLFSRPILELGRLKKCIY